MKNYFVVNPKSANGQTGKRWPEILAQLTRSLGECPHAFTERPLHASQLATRALEEGYECVVAVGGDGTINEVVNGFFREGRAINPKAAVGVVPRGTGGDFRKTFGWDDSLASAAARLSTDKTEPLDVGLVEFLDHRGQRGSRYFANIASFGISGQVDHEVNHSSKVLGGKLSFMLGSVKAFLKYADRTVHVSVDGGTEERLSITSLAVANGRYFGGGMMVAPTAVTSDGVFEVTVWSGYGLTDFALKSASIYDGTHVNWPGTRTLRCKALSARSDQDVLIDVDGEQPGRLPAAFSMLPAAIRLKI